MANNAPTLGQKFIAEFLGTAFLIFIGAGSITASGYLLHTRGTYTSADLLLVALAFGLALTIMAYAIGHISGCHINPAITIAAAVSRRMSWSDAGVYIIAQILGCLLGALLIALAYGVSTARTVGYGPTYFNVATTSYLQAGLLEAIGTFFLLMVIMATVIDRRAPAGWAGFSVGMTLAAVILVLGAVTGGSLNPARSFGPAVIQLLFGGSYPLPQLLVYIIGPIVGAIAGVGVYDYLVGRIGVGLRPEEIETRMRGPLRQE